MGYALHVPVSVRGSRQGSVRGATPPRGSLSGGQEATRARVEVAVRKGRRVALGRVGSAMRLSASKEGCLNMWA
jgi:hypothetical protein